LFHVGQCTTSRI